MKVTKKIKITPEKADGTDVFRATAIFRMPKEIALSDTDKCMITELEDAPLFEKHFDSTDRQMVISKDHKTIVISLARESGLINYGHTYTNNIREANLIFNHVEFVLNELLEER